MAEARLETAWDQTALLAAKIHNGSCAETRHMRDAAFFHPFRKEAPGQLPKLTMKERRKLMPRSVGGER